MIEEGVILGLLKGGPKTVGEIKHAYCTSRGERIGRCDLRAALRQLERKGLVSWVATDRLKRGEWPDRRYSLVEGGG